MGVDPSDALALTLNATTEIQALWSGSQGACNV